MKKVKVERPAMYFSTLEVENVKSFGEKQILDLKNSEGKISPWTLILGDNGVGKTTLLKCLAWMIPVEAPSIISQPEQIENTTVEKTKVIVKPYMDDLDESNFEQLIRIGNDIKTRISVTVSNGIKLGESPTEETTVTVAMDFEKINGKLEVVTPQIGELKEFNSPNIFAYSANRHLAYKNLENSDLKDPISNLFSDSGDLYDAEQLLSMLDTASIRQGNKGKATDLLLKIKEILVDLLPDIKDPNSIIVNSPINDDGSINKDLVEVQTDDGKVKLFDLSLGYVTMLTWIVDLAVRMLWRFPESSEPLKEPSIVIVDEIDLHLHPIWQRVIMQKLTYHFSRTQFICTAHSPFMAQASENQNLCVVNRIDETIHIKNEPALVKGWRIGQIITSDLFGIESERSPEIEELVLERRRLLDKGTLSNQESDDLKALDEQIADLPILGSENQRLLDQINLAAKILREKGELND